MPIRLRVALVFVAALAVAFAVGGWLFYSQLSASLLNATDAALAAQLSQADRYLAAPRTAPRPAVDAKLLPGEYVVQVLDASGRIRAASADAGSRPLLPPAAVAQARRGEVALTSTIDDDPARLLAAPFAGRPGWVAIAGVSLDESSRTLGGVTNGLLIGGISFLILAGVGAYWLARAALAPVERMRREAAALSSTDTGSTLQVPRTHDEIAALAVTMNDLLLRLRRALARQRAFAADASHELRTPFAVLAGELELAGRPGRSKEELAAAVTVAGEEVTRLARITDDLLLLARGDEGKLVIKPEPADIGALLAQSAERAGSRAGTVGVACRVDAPAGLMATVDPGRIRQAVDNLVDNALRFAPRGTDVVLSAGRTGAALVIEVRDCGPGFPPDFLPYAFERFRRPDRDRARSEGGAGLGLAIVRAITLAHGGQVSARNLPDGGAVVRLEIPGDPRPRT
ncbi:MAG TPA: HAMP domain-containing sensor histidine kinase [Streptosporangiaceae bacterium]